MLVTKHSKTEKFPYDGNLVIRINKNESTGYIPKPTKEVKK